MGEGPVFGSFVIDVKREHIALGSCVDLEPDMAIGCQSQGHQLGLISFTTTWVLKTLSLDSPSSVVTM